MTQTATSLSITLAEPKSQIAHLLYEMIKGKRIAEQDYVYNRFRGNISDLIHDHGVVISHEDVPFKSSFGRKSYYRRHYIMIDNREHAIEVYNSINK